MFTKEDNLIFDRIIEKRSTCRSFTEQIPSKEDIEATKRLFMASKLIGIQLADHLIVSKVGWYSMLSEGILNFEEGGSK